MYIMNSTENMPFIVSSAASFLPSKVASSGHMTVWSAGEKTLRLHVRTHPDDGEDAKNYTFNGDAILVEAKTGCSAR